MAIILEAAYSKKLGLPNYSSHSYVVSIRTELGDITQVQEESSKLYAMLQEAVDKEIREVGFMPDATQYGMNNGGSSHGDRNGNGNGHGHENGSVGNGGHASRGSQPRGDSSGISERQLDLINRIVRESNANKTEIDNLCVEMFGGGVRTMNRMQASNFIDELFVRFPRRNGSARANPPREPARA